MVVVVVEVVVVVVVVVVVIVVVVLVVLVVVGFFNQIRTKSKYARFENLICSCLPIWTYSLGKQ